MITRRINTKVAGVTFNNIQAYLPNVKKDDKLQAVFEPDNPYDKNAIALYHNGNKIGYIPRKHAKALTQNDKLNVTVFEVTGGNELHPIRGCNIFIQVDDGITYSKDVATNVLNSIFNL